MLFGFNKIKRILPIIILLPMALVMTQCAESFDLPTQVVHNEKAFIASEDGTAAVITHGDTPQLVKTLTTGGHNDVTATFGHVYVNNSGANSVGVIDANKDVVLSPIGVGERPVHAKIVKGGNLLLVGNDGPKDNPATTTVDESAADDSISVIDTNPNNTTFLLEIARIRVGNGHHKIAFSDVTERVAVTNLSAATTSVVDINILQTICTVPVGSVPHGIDYSDISGHAYVANVADPTEAITIINLDGSITVPADPHKDGGPGTCSATLDLGGLTKGTGVGQIPASGFTHTNHAGTFVYTVGYDSATKTGFLSVIDTSTDTVPAGGVVSIANFKPDKFAITEDDSRIYVSSVEDAADPVNVPGTTVAVFDVNTGTGIPAPHPTTPSITVGRGANHRAIALSTDDLRLFVPNSGADPGTVSVIDTATLSVIATIQVGDEPNTLVYVDAQTLKLPTAAGGGGGHHN